MRKLFAAAIVGCIAYGTAFAQSDPAALDLAINARDGAETVEDGLGFGVGDRQGGQRHDAAANPA